jgi:anti-sigma regulatory factor (Ser/Thr protein kinase)
MLALAGELSLRSVGTVRGAVGKALAESGRVLVDVSGLRLTWPPALQTFPSIVSAAGGWPVAHLVLFGPGPELARSLTVLRVSLTVPVAPDERTARRLLTRRPAVVARHLDLDPQASSPRRGRWFVRDACRDWQLDALRDDAMLVASELVTNAVTHAGTTARLVVRYDGLGLIIRVRDRRPDRALPLRSADARPPGYGLALVAAVSGDFGVTTTQSLKSVWAFLPVDKAAATTRAIRRAADDAVRAALAFGTDSPDAPRAVHHITARVGAQHGGDGIRQMIDQLALELAQAEKGTAAAEQRGEDDPLG